MAGLNIGSLNIGCVYVHRYATKAIDRLNTWFIDNETKMVTSDYLDDLLSNPSAELFRI